MVMNAVADLGITVEQPEETLDDIAAIRRLTTPATQGLGIEPDADVLGPPVAVYEL